MYVIQLNDTGEYIAGVSRLQLCYDVKDARLFDTAELAEEMAKAHGIHYIYKYKVVQYKEVNE